MLWAGSEQTENREVWKKKSDINNQYGKYKVWHASFQIELLETSKNIFSHTWEEEWKKT